MRFSTPLRSALFALLILTIVQLACGAPGPSTPTGSTPAPSGTSASMPPATTQAAATQASTTLPTSTGEHATPAEAQAMLNQAVQHYQSVGRQQALQDFTDKKVRKPPLPIGTSS